MLNFKIFNKIIFLNQFLKYIINNQIRIFKKYTCFFKIHHQINPFILNLTAFYIFNFD